MSLISLTIPELLEENKIGKNMTSHIVLETDVVECDVEEHRNGRHIFYIARPNNGLPPILLTKDKVLEGYEYVLKNLDIENFSLITLHVAKRKWILHPKKGHPCTKADVDSIPISRKNKFNFQNGKISDNGLRPPQIGGMCAITAHRLSDNKIPGTVVMPTGTGKTETMLSTIVSNQCDKVLIIVPSNALRQQTYKKALNLGILKKIDTIQKDTILPVVVAVDKNLGDNDTIEHLIDNCNIMICTPNIMQKLSSEQLNLFSTKFNYLFFDEAHHIAAPTRERLKREFVKKNKKILQFTATPFRNDKKSIGGKIIFNYSLGKAQEESYFKTINFKPIYEFSEDKVDEAIVKKAIEQLEIDIREHDYQHIIMARTNDIPSAEAVIEIYRRYGADYNPVILHSKLKKDETKQNLDLLKNGQSKIVVCVDMLGEGVDIPQLKIAALHDVHKSLGITLQFIGRFVRDSSLNIGDATVVANIADIKVKEALKSLYSEDANRNSILRYLSENQIEREVKLQDMVDGFNGELKDELPLQNLLPKLSTTVYKIENYELDVEKLIIEFSKRNEVVSSVNDANNVIVIITKTYQNIEWGKIREINDTIRNMYIFYMNTEQNLLFVNTTSKDIQERFIRVLKEDATKIYGEDVYKSFHGINRMLLYSVGLKEKYLGPIRYKMYSGIDVKPAIGQGQRTSSIKANIFGMGYENGEPTSIGASYKGKIWARKVGSLVDLIEWCNLIGGKLIDSSISTEDVLEGTLKRELLKNPGDIVALPVFIDWPILLENIQTPVEIKLGENVYLLDELGIQIVERAQIDEGITFKIFGENVELFMNFIVSAPLKDETKPNYSYSIIGGTTPATIKIGRNTYGIADFFMDNPPCIWFSDSTQLLNNLYIKGNQDIVPYDKEKIEILDWLNVDKTKESQGHEKTPGTIQHYMIGRLASTGEYQIIYNDDGPAEIADILAFKVNDTEKIIDIELYHCKYSSSEKEGDRIKDFYEVCGQAQKSAHWKEGGNQIEKIVKHLLKRDNRWQHSYGVSRFEVGDESDLKEIQKKTSIYIVKYKVIIVQPGLSRKVVSMQILYLLSTTELYLAETVQMPLTIITSE